MDTLNTIMVEENAYDQSVKKAEKNIGKKKMPITPPSSPRRLHLPDDKRKKPIDKVADKFAELQKKQAQVAHELELITKEVKKKRDLELKSKRNKRTDYFKPQSGDSTISIPEIVVVREPSKAIRKQLWRAFNLEHDLDWTFNEFMTHAYPTLAAQAIRYLRPIPEDPVQDATTAQDAPPTDNSSRCAMGEGERFEPQMFGFGGENPSFTIGADHSVLAAVAEMRGSVEEIRDSMTKVGVDMKAAAQSIKIEHGLSDQLKSGLCAVQGAFGSISVVVLLIAIVLVVKPKTVMEKSLVFTLMGSIMATRINWSSFLTMDMFKWFSKDESQVEPQSYVTDDLVSIIAGFLNTFMFCGAGRRLFDPKELGFVLGSMSRTQQTVNSVISSMNTLFKYIYSATDSWFNNTPYFLPTGAEFVDSFLKEAQAILRSAEDKEMSNTPGSLDKVRASVEAGELVIKKIPGTSQFVSMRMLVTNTVTELRKLGKTLASMNFKFSGLRPEPASILMIGSPGVGKSQAMQHLANALNALILDDEAYQRYVECPGTAIFNRQAEAVYWDGYQQDHNICFFDDVLQAKDIAGNPDNEAMNVIRAVNVFEYQLHMAKLEDKGNTNFRSNIVIANSNSTNFHLESLVDIRAFLRRWDVVVKVYPKPEYCVDPNASLANLKFDFKNLPKVTEGDLHWEGKDFGVEMPLELKKLKNSTKLHPDFCDYHLQVLKDRQFVDAGVVLSFHDMVLMAYETYEMKQTRHVVYQHCLDTTGQKYRAIRDETRLPLFDEIQMDKLDEFVHTVSTPDPYRLPMFDFNEEVKKVPLEVQTEPLLERFAPQGNYMSLEDPIHHLENIPSDYFYLPKSKGISDWYHSIWTDNRDLWYAVDTTTKLALIKASEMGVLLCPDDVLWSIQETDCLFLKTEIREKNIYSVDYDSYSNRLIEDYVSHKRTPRYITWSSKLLEQIVALRARLESGFYKAREEVPGFVSMIYAAWKTSFAHLLTMGKGFFDNVANKTNMMFGFISDSPIFASVLAGVGTVTSMITIVGIIWKLVDYFRSPAQAPQSDERHTRTGRARVARTLRGRTPVTPQSLEISNSQLTSSMKMVLTKSMFMLALPLPKSDRAPGRTHTQVGYVLAVRGHCILLPYHYAAVVDHNYNEGDIDLEDTIWLLNVNDKNPDGTRKREFQLTVSEWIDSVITMDEATERDLIMLRLPQRFNPKRDIVDHFITDNQMEQYTNVNVALMIPGEEWKQIYITHARANKFDIPVGSDLHEEYKVKNTFSYTAETNAGDCGSILFVDDKRWTNSIAGMHIAGTASTKMGISAQISKGFLERYLAIAKETYKHVDKLDLALDPQAASKFANLLHLGAMPQGKYPQSSGKSKIRRSPIYGVVSEVKTGIAKLRPFEAEGGIKIDPMEIAASGYCKEAPFIPPKYVRAAEDSLFDHLNNTSPIRVAPRILGFEEAVLGVPGGSLGPIPRNTSSGYPYNVAGGPSSKKIFFGDGEEYTFDSPKCLILMQEVQDILVSARKGERQYHIFTDNLKDERRPLKKVCSGQTRLVSGCPVALLIAMRMFFGSFVNWTLENRIRNGLAAGICEYSDDWDVLAAQLNKFGSYKNIGAGDYHGFDKCHPNPLMYAILGIINRWYNDSWENQQVRSILWLEVVNSLHVNEGQLYMWTSALPSGIFPTQTIASLANHLAFRICWNMKMNPNLGCSHDFNKNVYLIVLGDDNVFAVNPTCMHLFNESTVSEMMKLIGYDYTPEDKEKSSFVVGGRSLSEVSFLKRHFRKHSHSGRYVAPLSLETILDLLNWRKEGGNAIGDLEVNVSIALTELCLHDLDTFQKWQPRIIEAINNVSGASAPPKTTYYSLFQEIIKRNPGGTILASVLTDYGLYHGNFPGPQVIKERSEPEQAGVFTLTSKLACWQTQQELGTPGDEDGLTQPPLSSDVSQQTQTKTP
jgi:hypothetical protein